MQSFVLNLLSGLYGDTPVLDQWVLKILAPFNLPKSSSILGKGIRLITPFELLESAF